MIGNQKDLAQYLGLNKSSVSRAVHAGRIQAEPDGRFDFEKCAAAWHASTGGRADLIARHAAQRGAAIPKGQPIPQNAPAASTAPTVPAAPVTDDLDIDLDSGNRNKAKALILHYENSLIKIEMSLRRALRYDLATALRESDSLGATLRAGLERVIDTCAPRLAATADPKTRHHILAQEMKRLRTLIKREMPRSLRRMREAGRGTGGTAT